MKHLCVLVMVFLLGATLGAQTVTLSYADPGVQYLQGSSWKATTLGQTLESSAQLRVPKGALAIITLPGTSIQLKEGLFKVGDLVAGAKPKDQGVIAGVGQKLKLLSSGSDKAVTAVGGVRASEAANPSTSLQWVEEDSPFDLVKNGESKLAAKDLENSRKEFSSAIKYALPAEQTQIRIAIADACVRQGFPALGMMAIQDYDPGAGSQAYPDWALAKASVLMESYQHASVLSWIDEPLARTLATPYQQRLMVMKALANLALGNQAAYAATLDAAVALDPGSEVAKAATAR